jgi:hypothetical protein
MNQEHLTAIVNTFVLPSRRARLLEFLVSKRRYPDFLDNLLHDSRYLNPQVIVELPGNERSVDAVLAHLRALGGGDEAYLVGHCAELEDGQTGSLRTLLEACVGSMDDALVYCPRAKVAYYEGHEGFGYILRPAPNTRLQRSART